MFTMIDERLREQEFKKALNLELKDAQEREGKIRASLEKAWSEFREGGDKFAAIASIGGGKDNTDETLQTIIKMNSEQAALVDAIDALNGMTNLGDRIKRQNEGAAEARGEAPGEIDIAEAVRNFFRVGPSGLDFHSKVNEAIGNSAYGSIKELATAKSGIEINFDDSLQVWNTLLKGGAGTANAGASGTAAWPTDFMDAPGFVPFATREIQVIDLFPFGATDKAAINYLEETTYGPNPTARFEGAKLAEANFQLTRKSEPVQSIGHQIPIVQEQLEDEPQIRNYLNNRMAFGVRQEVDSQVLLGNGTAPNLEGLLERSAIQTRAKASGENSMDTLLKAQYDITLGGRAMAGPYVMHHLDWAEIQLLQSTAGGYYMGDPRMDFGRRLWARPVVLTDHLARGNGLTGDFTNFSELTVRHDVRVEFGESGDDFEKLIVRCRAYVRLALCVFRHKAFVSVTGLNS